MKLIAVAFPKTKLFLKYLALVTIYSAAVVWFDDHYFPRNKFHETKELTATISIIIGLLLAFRTNSAYERWWEGRKLWGQLVNEIRNFSLKCHAFLSKDKAENIGELLIAFAHVLKNHLRGQNSNLADFKIAENKSVSNQPLFVAELVYKTIEQWKSEKIIDGLDLLFLDTHARSLMDISGACERILKSPISSTYKYIIWLWLFLYLLFLPWLLAPELDLVTIPVMIVGSYFIFAVELLAEEVEEPFGNSAADLPLDNICQTIDESVRQIMESGNNN